MRNTPCLRRCPGGAANWGVPVVALTAWHVDLEACGTALSARRPPLNPADVEELALVNLEQPLSATPDGTFARKPESRVRFPSDMASVAGMRTGEERP